MKYCLACDNLTKHNMKIRLNGKSFKIPMCENCQFQTAVELMKDNKEHQGKHSQ